jgi:ERG8-type phosphomevalonate kinase
MMEITSTAYGKILVFGGYNILEPGHVGLVLSVNKGTTTTVKETQTGKILFDLKNFKITVSGYKKEHKLFFKKDYEVINFLKNAVEYTYKYLKTKEIKLKDIELISENDSELIYGKKKTGFGSSATATVSAIDAILKLHGIDDKDVVFKIARYSHYKSQGSGSGFDVSCAVYGSQFFYSSKFEYQNFEDYMDSEYKPNYEIFYYPVKLIPILIFTGKSASTKKLVDKVLKYKQKEPEEYSILMDKYNKINKDLKNAFILNDFKKIKINLNKVQEILIYLSNKSKANIVPDNIIKLIDNLNQNGAYATSILGAGGGDSILVFCLDRDNEDKILNYCKKNNYYVFKGLKIR